MQGDLALPDEDIPVRARGQAGTRAWELPLPRADLVPASPELCRALWWPLLLLLLVVW